MISGSILKKQHSTAAAHPSFCMLRPGCAFLFTKLHTMHFITHVATKPFQTQTMSWVRLTWI